MNKLKTILLIIALFCLAVVPLTACSKEEEPTDDTPATYTITYENVENATHNNPTSYQEGSTLALTDATKTGYNFLGWFIGDDEIETLTGKKANLTIEAKWQIITNQVSFNSDGGSNVTSQTIDYGQTATKPTDPTKTGYTFLGWYIGEDEFDFATEIYAATEITAKWQIKEYQVSFNTDGAGTIDNQTIDYGQTATKPTDPTKTGYTFLGWYIGEDEFDFATPISGTTELTAKWQIITYQVSFNSDGGSSVTAQTIDYGQTATKPTDPTKTGYTFLGWYIGEDEFDFTTQIYAATEVTAKWQAEEYDISFDANGGNIVGATFDKYSAENTPALPTAEKTNLVFVGWFNEGTLVESLQGLTGTLALKAEYTQLKSASGFVYDDDSGVYSTSVSASYAHGNPTKAFTITATFDTTGNGWPLVGFKFAQGENNVHFIIGGSVVGYTNQLILSLNGDATYLNAAGQVAIEGSLKIDDKPTVKLVYKDGVFYFYKVSGSNEIGICNISITALNRRLGTSFDAAADITCGIGTRNSGACLISNVEVSYDAELNGLLSERYGVTYNGSNNSYSAGNYDGDNPLAYAVTENASTDFEFITTVSSTHNTPLAGIAIKQANSKTLGLLIEYNAGKLSLTYDNYANYVLKGTEITLSGSAGSLATGVTVKFALTNDTFTFSVSDGVGGWTELGSVTVAELNTLLKDDSNFSGFTAGEGFQVGVCSRFARVATFTNISYVDNTAVVEE